MGRRDGCSSCVERGIETGKEKEKDGSVQETDYDDHILNYVLHISKDHISFAVIFKAFPLGIKE